MWALTRLHTASLAPELTPCQATGKGDFRPLWEIGFLGELGSLDLLWGNVELEQDAGGFAGPSVCMSRVGERTPRWVWGLWEKSFPLRLPLLFLRDSLHSLKPAFDGRCRRGHGFGQEVGAQIPAPPIPPLHLPLLLSNHLLPARPLEQNPASTVQFLLEQIVAGIVGYLNPHIISSSVLH